MGDPNVRSADALEPTEVVNVRLDGDTVMDGTAKTVNVTGTTAGAPVAGVTVMVPLYVPGFRLVASPVTSTEGPTTKNLIHGSLAVTVRLKVRGIVLIRMPPFPAPDMPASSTSEIEGGDMVNIGGPGATI